MVKVRFEAPDQSWRKGQEVSITQLSPVSLTEGRSYTSQTGLTLPYLSERVCSDMAPSPMRACTSATSSYPFCRPCLQT